MKRPGTFSFPFLVFVLLGLSNASFAQSSDVDMADLLRQDGKIYVVVSVLGVIFIGIIVYMILIDRRLKKLEKNTGKR